MSHESPEAIGFFPQCQWTFCTNEAMIILHADVSNGDPQGEQQSQMIYAFNIHYGVWAEDLGIPDDSVEELDNYVPF